MDGQRAAAQHSGKKIDATEREMTTALFLLRAAQLGVAIADLDLLTIGMLQDMYIEAINDGASYARVATQEDFDRF